MKIRFQLPQTEQATRSREGRSGFESPKLWLTPGKGNTLFTNSLEQRRLSARHGGASCVLSRSSIPKLMRWIYFLWFIQRMPNNLLLISKLHAYAFCSYLVLSKNTYFISLVCIQNLETLH